MPRSAAAAQTYPAVSQTDQDKTVLQRQIVSVDRQLDQLVYELYGLNDAEIAIVEAAATR